MPTTRPRHVITETDDIAAALAAASRAWPEADNNKNALLRRLVQAGHESLRRQHAGQLAQFDQAVGSLTGTYPENYLDELREDWPA